MSEVNSKAESKVEVKRLRGRNSYDVINQIMESFNSSQGWALKKVSMLGMNIDVVVERSADQAPKAEKTPDAKEVSNAKQSKEETAKTSEPQTESKEVVDDVEDAQSTPNTSDKPTTKRGRAATKK